MSAEFVRHIKHSFILKGPREQTEGGNRNVTPIVPEGGPSMVNEGVPNNEVLIDKGKQNNKAPADDSVGEVGE